MTHDELVALVLQSKSGDPAEATEAKKLLRMHAVSTRNLSPKESAHVSSLRAKHGRADVELR